MDNEPTENEVDEETTSEIIGNQEELSTDEETEDITEETDTDEVENKFQWLYDELAGNHSSFHLV